MMQKLRMWAVIKSARKYNRFYLYVIASLRDTLSGTRTLAGMHASRSSPPYGRLRNDIANDDFRPLQTYAGTYTIRPMTHERDRKSLLAVNLGLGTNIALAAAKTTF